MNACLVLSPAASIRRACLRVILMLLTLPAGVSVASAGSPLHLSATGMHFNVCCFPTSMLASDLTGSGHLDLVTGDGMSNDVSVLMHDGAGGFTEPLLLPLDNVSYGYVVVAAGDINGDGHPDLLAAGFNDTDIALFSGDGHGGFASPTIIDIGTGVLPRAIALADVNADGHLDIVTANNESDNVSVLLGDGAGGFAPAQPFAAGTSPVAMAVVDLNADGKPDIVVANAGSRDVSVLIGDGAGHFAAPVNTSVGAGAEPYALAVADVDGNASPDIVVASAGDDGSPFPPPELPGVVSILLNTGSGTFAAAVQRPAGPGEGRAHAVAVADISGDGHADIVVSRPNANAASILLGDGAGGFADAFNVPTSVGPGPIAIADVTGDGKLDIVAANAVSASISVLPGDGAGGVGFDGIFATGEYPFSVAAADLDGDGKIDVVTANLTSNDVSVLLNTGAGGFATEVRYAVGNSPASVAVGDINGDGHLDLAVANLGSGDVSILLGDGSGSFAPALDVGVGGDFESPYALALGDANGDGHLDIATANTNISNESISFLLGDGSGHFAPAVLYSLGDDSYYSPQGIVLADVTGDGFADIVTANLGASNLSLLAGDGNGHFAAATHLATDAGPVVVAAADVDGDGHADLVTVNQTAQSVSVLISDGAGDFADSVNHPIYPDQAVMDYKPWPWGMTLADIDGDGSPDIITANTQNDTVSVLLNDGNGGFGAFSYFGTGAHPGAVAVADIDGDGRPDVISANRDNNNVSVLFNTGGALDRIFADGFEGSR